MGGFVICTDRNNDKKMFIARPEQFCELAKKKIIDFPTNLKPLDIRDRSKGDGLTYFVAITQLAWFATQCIGRTVAGLSITLFELVSISFAPIAVIMYILWWQKPQNAQSPIVIVKNPVPEGSANTSQEGQVASNQEPNDMSNGEKPSESPVSSGRFLS
jgi:hypothetical protein